MSYSSFLTQMVRALSLLPILLKLADNLTALPETPAAAARGKRVALVSHKKFLPRGLIVARGQFHAGKVRTRSVAV